ncbi:MAG: hypothetical protein K2N46_08540, partial [Lachnospiraceae bacterium]|nr:hypothetical protein [Lachnospiraceae bacterium]
AGSRRCYSGERRRVAALQTAKIFLIKYLYSQAMKFAARSAADLAGESGCMAGFCDRKYKYQMKLETGGKTI